MAEARNRRGGPLIALAVILGCWVGVRVAMISTGGPAAVAGMPHPELASFEEQGEIAIPAVTATKPEASVAASISQSPRETVLAPVPEFAPPPARRFEPVAPIRQGHAIAPMTKPAALPVNVAAGHQLLWMAALSRMALPAGFGAAIAPPRAVPAPFYPAGAAPAGARRWSADGWLLLRRGAGGTLAAGATPGTYGASQAGAVLRYRLSLQNRRRPEAYARVSSALNSPADRDLALGVSARPLPTLPLRAMAELRISDQAGATRLRPAAMVVTELQPVDLPYGTRAEFYGQAGYVGGREATPFADGQARLDKRITQIGKAELRAGAGAWAGAQKGAARLDAGPSAVLGLPVGDSGAARLGLDWRMRVAGDARPGSGVALTLSAGF
jgi:hypothetical protein